MEGLGKSDSWHLSQMGWMNVEKLNKFVIQKYTYRMINNDQEHYFRNYLLQNRNDQKRMACKLGPHKPQIGRSHFTQNTYLYRAIDIYNQLPDLITRMTRFSLFKLWLKKLNKNTRLEIPENQLNPINCIQDLDYLQIMDNDCMVEHVEQ